MSENPVRNPFGRVFWVQFLSNTSGVANEPRTSWGGPFGMAPRPLWCLKILCATLFRRFSESSYCETFFCKMTHPNGLNCIKRQLFYCKPALGKVLGHFWWFSEKGSLIFCLPFFKLYSVTICLLHHKLFHNIFIGDQLTNCLQNFLILMTSGKNYGTKTQQKFWKLYLNFQ